MELESLDRISPELKDGEYLRVNFKGESAIESRFNPSDSPLSIGCNADPMGKPLKPFARALEKPDCSAYDEFHLHGCFLKHPAPNDNSCLFWAIRIGVQTSDMPQTMRAIVAEKISSDPQKYSVLLMGMTPDAYCAYIQNEGTWGGDVELGLLSEYYKIEIEVHDFSGQEIIKHNCGADGSYHHKITLLYDGQHYECLFWREDGVAEKEYQNYSVCMFPAKAAVPSYYGYLMGAYMKYLERFFL